MNKPNFLPGIEQYLEQVIDKNSITTKELDYLIYRMCGVTGLKYETSKIIVRTCFQEMRNAVLRGDVISITDFGKLFLSSPKTTNSKKRIFVKFKPYKTLLKEIND